MSDVFPKTISSAPDENLRRLLFMRFFSVSGQLVAILIAIYYLELSLPVQPLVVILFSLVVWSLLTLFLFKRPEDISDNVFFAQLVVDALSLTAILYYTGGATNPFAWFLLVPHSVASTLLSRRYAGLMALITSLSYTLIVFYYRPLVHLDHPLEMGMSGHFQEHVIGMWIGFVLSTILMAYFVAGMAESLRKRNELLIKMQERIFRDERLVALGTLATGAAHELGTPLGTMDVIAHELELEFRDAADDGLSKKLSLMQGQIKRCKNVLLTITQTAAEDKYDSGQLLSVDEYIANVVAQWRISHLGVDLRESINGLYPVPQLMTNATLTHAIINILDNAAEASPDFVSISLDWKDENMLVVIEDHGQGMDESKLALLGKQLVSSKDAGMGVGLYLTKATVERMGGQVCWENRKPCGVIATISIPLSI